MSNIERLAKEVNANAKARGLGFENLSERMMLLKQMENNIKDLSPEECADCHEFVNRLKSTRLAK